MSRHIVRFEVPEYRDLVQLLRDAIVALDTIRPLSEDVVTTTACDQVAPRIREVLAQYDLAIAQHQQLSKLCRICEDRPRVLGYDHCCEPGCIPF